MIDLFTNKAPVIGLEQRALGKNTVEYMNSTLKKIHNARVKSENDILKLSYLIGSYIGNMSDFEADPNGKLKALVLGLQNSIIEPLESKSSNLKRGTTEWADFHRKNKPSVTEYLFRLNAMVNATEDKPLQIAMVRPIVKYEYKVLSGGLIGKTKREGLTEKYTLTGQYNNNQEALNNKIEQEIRRVYMPTIAGFSLIGIGLSITLLNIFKRRKK